MADTQSNMPDPQRWTRWLPWVLIAAGLLVYLPSLSAPFIYDDLVHISKNPAIRHLDQIGDILTGDRRKLVRLSLAINYALDGDNPRGYHLFNILIHIAASLCIYGLVRRTLQLPAFPQAGCLQALRTNHPETPSQEKWSNAAHWLALATAGLWLLHPLNTQAVAYIIQRGESMMAMFYLLTLYAVLRAATTPLGGWWYLIAVVVCMAGMMSKEVMVTAPVMALLYDRTFLAGSFAQALRKRWGLYVALAACWGFLWATGLGGVVTPPSEPSNGVVGFGVSSVTPLNYLATQSAVICQYLRLAVWPHPLVFDYAWPMAQHVTDNWPQSVVVLILLVGTCAMLWRKPAWGFFGAWFFIILSPTSSFVPIRHAIFEYRMYLPLVGVVALMVFGVHVLLRRRRHLATALACVAAVALAFLTVNRLDDYQSSLRLWESVLRARPNNPDAMLGYGLALKDAGDSAGAIEQFHKAIALDQNHLEAALNIGVTYFEAGRLDDAAHWYGVALKMKPDDADVNYNLAKVAHARGDMKEAERLLRRAIELNAEHVKAHDLLGVLLAASGRTAEAESVLTAALEIDPGYAYLYHNLGLIRLEQQRYDQAMALLRKADDLLPGNPTIMNNLGRAFAETGHLEHAIGFFQRVLQIDAGNVIAWRNLSAAYQMTGREAEAVRALRQVVTIVPDAAATLRQLAWLLATSPNAELRNGADAVVFAERAVKLTGGQNLTAADVLAAAYAEAGRYEQAVATMQKTLSAAAAAGAPADVINLYQQRLIQYRAGKPWRD